MQLKTRSVVGRYVHVLSTDPALNRGSDGDTAEAAKEREVAANAYRVALETSDVSMLPLREGAQPTIYELTHLSADAGAWLIDQGQVEGNTRLSLHAVALALVGIKGALDEEGQPVKFTRKRNAQRGGFLALEDDLLDAIVRTEDGRMNIQLIRELGGRVARELVPRNG